MELLKLYEAGKLDFEGVKQLVTLLKLRVEALEGEEPEQARLSVEKALAVIQQLEERSGTSDLELDSWRSALEKLRAGLP